MKEYTKEQCVNFVKHIQNHLANKESGLKLYKLRDKPLEVGCAICGLTIDAISQKIEIVCCDLCDQNFKIEECLSEDGKLVCPCCGQEVEQ